MYRITAKQSLLLDRADPLLFGFFGWPDTDEKHIVKEAGSGIFVAPHLGLSARHVSKSFEKFDPQFDAFNRRKTPLDPQYQMKPVVTAFASMVYQVTRWNPSPEGEQQILWKVQTAFGSFDTDIVALLAEPRTEAARKVESRQRYFQWELLPPRVGSLVTVYGLPGQRIEIERENHEVGADVWWWNARVERHRRFYAHGFGEFPVYELSSELPGGFSGAPVFCHGRLAGIFIGPALVACLWPLALHKYYDTDGREYSFSEHFDDGLIDAWDWHEVKGRVERAPCSEVVAGLEVDPCSKTHVVLR